MMPSVYNYGLILGGLLFPIAQLPRLTDEDRMFAVSYTHLDVYKRQVHHVTTDQTTREQRIISRRR